MNAQEKDNVIINGTIDLSKKRAEKEQAKTPKKKRTRLTLDTPKRVRHYMQNILVQVENDEITESKARLMLNGAESILKAINAKETEERIIELELALEELERNKE